MKKILTALLLIAGMAGSAKADFLGGGNIRDKSFALHFSSAVIASSTTADWVLIDLSSNNAVNGYPHSETGFVSVANVRIVMDKAAATTATAKLGVVTSINFSSGTVAWFYSSDQVNNVSNTMSLMDSNEFESVFNLRVNNATPIGDSGVTPRLITNSRSVNSTVYNSTTTLKSFFSPTSNALIPEVGDVILNVTKAASAATVTVDLIYYTDRR